MKHALAALLALAGLAGASAGTAAKPLSYTLLYNFCTQGGCADGSLPTSGLVADAKGNLFGVTETGGAHNQGIVFELERRKGSYALKVLHDFCFSCGDGVFPVSALVIDVKGNLYGATLGGGAHDCGIVFRLAPGKARLTVLHDFCTQAGDGNSPDTALVYAGKSAGAPYDGVSALYGTTPSGGAHQRGTVFALAPAGKSWSLTTLYSFCALAGCADGGGPSGELLLDGAGNLFGNASMGGGAGVVYELSPTAPGAQMTEKVVHAFCAPDECADGQGPAGALVMTAKGEILGTTVNALGAEGGAIFRLSPGGGGEWQESLEHVFCATDCADGYFPSGGLTSDGGGNVYGVNQLGGTGEGGIGGGVAYRFRDGKLTQLYQFCSQQGCADGRLPVGNLLRDAHGRIFGVTAQGGPKSAAGTVFRLSR
jgi:uncharacterized repeat protein (TIGR03803 family)